MKDSTSLTWTADSAGAALTEAVSKVARRAAIFGEKYMFSFEEGGRTDGPRMLVDGFAVDCTC